MCKIHRFDKYLLGAGIVLASGDMVTRKRCVQPSSNPCFVKKEGSMCNMSSIDMPGSHSHPRGEVSWKCWHLRSAFKGKWELEVEGGVL